MSKLVPPHGGKLLQRLLRGEELAEADAGFAEAVFHGMVREIGVMFPPRETLLLRRGNDRAIGQQRRGTVVIEGGNAKDMGHSRNLDPVPQTGGSKNRVDEGCDGGALGENQQAAEQDHDDQNRQQPEFLSNAHEAPKVGNKRHRASSIHSFVPP